MTSENLGVLGTLLVALLVVAGVVVRRAGRGGSPTPPGAGTSGILRQPGSSGATETIEVDPRTVKSLRISYAPSRNGAPDPGEIIWTWVPYAEDDGRGKDRPMLVIAAQAAERVYAVKLTSKSHDGDRDFLSIGSGPWDAQGRESWVDTDQLYSVHVGGVRREAAALDRSRFERVARVLQGRFGWTAS